MKKKIKLIIPLFLLTIIILPAILILSGNRAFSKGIVYIDRGAVYFLDKNNSPILPIMQNKISQNQFNKLSSGDEIILLHDGINESYPGQTGAYFIIKTGSENTVPEEAINEILSLKPDEKVYSPTGRNETDKEPVYATCGNTLTTIIKDGKEYSFMYDNSVYLFNLLGNLRYEDDYITETPEFTVRLEDKVDYYVNLTEGWVCTTEPSELFGRDKTGVCTLTDAQIQYIGFIVNCETD
ncbi:MAG: hypothetical protein J1E34_08715 [Oscillospiraceae bacterium]|nr:hypothetical protein [Oscillospiraceae bacterium]